MINRWSLPGPSGFISRAVNTLREGFSLVLATPLVGPATLAESLRISLADGGWMVYGPLEPGSLSPLDHLYVVLDITDGDRTRRTVSTLLRGMEPASIVIVDGIRPDHWPEWKRFLGDYEATSRGIARADRPLLVAITSGLAIAELGRECAALKNYAWQDVIGEFDTMLYVIDVLRNRPSQTGNEKLLSHMIARLALWDLDLACLLAEREEQLLFEPVEALRSVLNEFPPVPAMTECWETGGLMKFDGIQLPHPFLLLAQPAKHEVLRQRIWEAQAGELLPLLELQRYYWAQRMKELVKGPIRLGDQQLDDIDELELGQLAYLAKIKNLKNSIKQPLETLRRYRNKLAHMEPLDYMEAFDPVLRPKSPMAT